MTSASKLLQLVVIAIAVTLSAGAAQAGVLTSLNFGSNSLDAGGISVGPGYYCPFNDDRPCFSDVTQVLSGHGAIEHVALTATLGNPFSLGELSLYLAHDGVTVVLFKSLSHSQGFGAPVTITFDDLAAGPMPSPLVSGTFRPDSPLSAFNGLDASGDWTLTLGDWDPGDSSSYSGAVLSVTIPEPATLVLLAIGLVGLGFSWRRKEWDSPLASVRRSR